MVKPQAANVHYCEIMLMLLAVTKRVGTVRRRYQWCGTRATMCADVARTHTHGVSLHTRFLP